MNKDTKVHTTRVVLKKKPRKIKWFFRRDLKRSTVGAVQMWRSRVFRSLGPTTGKALSLRS